MATGDADLGAAVAVGVAQGHAGGHGQVAPVVGGVPQEGIGGRGTVVGVDARAAAAVMSHDDLGLAIAVGVAESDGHAVDG